MLNNSSARRTTSGGGNYPPAPRVKGRKRNMKDREQEYWEKREDIISSYTGDTVEMMLDSLDSEYLDAIAPEYCHDAENIVFDYPY